MPTLNRVEFAPFPGVDGIVKPEARCFPFNLDRKESRSKGPSVPGNIERENRQKMMTLGIYIYPVVPEKFFPTDLSSQTDPSFLFLPRSSPASIYDTRGGRYVLWLIVLLSLTYFQFTAAARRSVSLLSIVPYERCIMSVPSLCRGRFINFKG